MVSSVGKYCATQGVTILDIAFQLIMFVVHLGVIVWNGFHPDVQQKYFVDFGNAVMYAGVACALASLELDVILLVLVARNADTCLYWWSYACLGCAIASWSAYMIITVYIWNLYLGIWGFFYLYIRVSVLMVAKADYLELFKTKDVDDWNDPSTFDLGVKSTLSTTTTYRVQTNTGGEEGIQLDTMENSFQYCSADLDSAPRDSVTFCTFLDSVNSQDPDHYMTRNEVILKANEESVMEELETKL